MTSFLYDYTKNNFISKYFFFCDNLILVIIMRQKTVWLLWIAIIGFVSMLIFVQLDLVDSIDVYGRDIQNIFVHSSFKTIFLMITNAMSAIGIITIVGITGYLLRRKDAKKDITLYISSILVCLAFTNIIKIVVRRIRPFHMLLEASGFSFPSSHSSIATIVYGYLILLINKYYQGSKKKIYISLCVFLVLLTGLSRIYFNVHYITDVIAGFCLGLIILCLSNFIMNKIDKTSKK